MSDPTSIKTPYDIKKLLARGFFYELMSNLLRHPVTEKVRSFVQETQPLWEEGVSLLALSHPKKLKESLNHLSHTITNTTDTAWASEYENCFGHVAHGKIPIYELEYGEEHSHRQPQELADITAFYHAFGLQISASAHERSDHAAIECEFMYFLITKEAYALERNDTEKAAICREASKKFLSHHLGLWFPSFTLRLSKFSEEGVMNPVAHFTSEFFIEDCRSLEVKAGPRDLPIRAVQEKEETGCVSCLGTTHPVS